MGGGNLGVDGYLNYRWEFLDPRVKEVREIVIEYERKLGYFSAVLVNAITPPSPMQKDDYAQMRKLQNAYQRLSFETLYMASEGEKPQMSKAEILENIDNQLGDKFNAIIIEAKKILEGYSRG